MRSQVPRPWPPWPPRWASSTSVAPGPGRLPAGTTPTTRRSTAWWKPSSLTPDPSRSTSPSIWEPDRARRRALVVVAVLGVGAVIVAIGWMNHRGRTGVHGSSRVVSRRPATPSLSTAPGPTVPALGGDPVNTSRTAVRAAFPGGDHDSRPGRPDSPGDGGRPGRAPSAASDAVAPVSPGQGRRRWPHATPAKGTFPLVVFAPGYLQCEWSTRPC